MLYRTKSFLSLSDYDGSRLEGDRLLHAIPSSLNSPQTTGLSYAPGLPYKEWQESQGRARLTIMSGMPPSRVSVQSRSIHKPPVKQPQPTASSSTCYTSPLGPVQKLLPPRAIFLHSTPKLGLHRAALERMMFTQWGKFPSYGSPSDNC